MTAVDPTHVQAELAQLLREIDLRTFAVTATMGAAGQVGSVGMVTQKLVAATGQQQALGRMQGVLLASSQLTEEDRRRYNSDGPLPVLTADSFAAAVQALADQARPRQAILKAVSSTFDLLTGAVPYETHYQQLPLLLPAEPDRLPREKKEKSEDPWGELRTSDILRWDEETRQEPTGDRPVRLQDLIQRFPQLVTKSRSNVPRFVLLGRPGAGKSTVLGYLRHLCRDTERPLLQQNPRLVPVLVKLPEWQRSAAKYGYSLPEYLARELYRDIAHAPSADLWRQWMARGQVLLLLDGLDETDASDEFRTRGLKPLLEGEAFRACPLVIACRTVSFEEHRWLGRDLPVFTLAPLEWRQQAEFIRKYPEDEHRPFDREALIQELRRQPGLRPLATNPQLLNIICYVVGSSGKTELPATRGDLYDRAITELLKRKDRKPELASGLMVSRKRRLLEEAALKLWLAGAERRQLVFREEEVLSALTEAAGGNEDRAEAVLNDVCANSGILRGQDGGFYSFLHLTLHEFLAACSLARRADADGLSAQILMGSGERLSLRELVLQKAYDPAWREVLPLLAGRVRKPQLMLDLFLNQLDEDAFHILLLTAGRCLAECAPGSVMLGAARIVVRWLAALLYSSAPCDRERAGPVLGALVGWPVVDIVSETLATGNEYARYESVRILGMLGDRQVIDALRRSQVDEDFTVRWESAKVLVSLGDEQIVSDLLRYLEDDSDAHRGIALSCFRAADRRAVDALYRHLVDSDPLVRRSAAQALGEISELRVSGELLRAAQDSDALVRRWAIRALAKSADDRCFDTIGQGVHDEDWRVRAAAVEALGELKRAAGGSLLIGCLDDPNPYVRKYAIDAVQKIEDICCSSVLAPLLNDDDTQVRWAATQALSCLGDGTAEQALLEIVRTGDVILQVKAGDALRKTISPHGVDTLLDYLDDDSPEVRGMATSILGNVGGPAAFERLMTRLEDDNDIRVRNIALFALGRLGDPRAINHLSAQTRADDGDTRWAAYNSLRMLRDPRGVDALLHGLRETDYRLRVEAIRALAQIDEPQVVDAFLECFLDSQGEVDTVIGWALSSLARKCPQRLPVIFRGLLAMLRALTPLSQASRAEVYCRLAEIILLNPEGSDQMYGSWKQTCELATLCVLREGLQGFPLWAVESEHLCARMRSYESSTS